jgi:hypothetical protein
MLRRHPSKKQARRLSGIPGGFGMCNASKGIIESQRANVGPVPDNGTGEPRRFTPPMGSSCVQIRSRGYSSSIDQKKGLENASDFSSDRYRLVRRFWSSRHLDGIGRHMGLFIRKMFTGLRKSRREILQYILQQGTQGQTTSENLQVASACSG